VDSTKLVTLTATVALLMNRQPGEIDNIKSASTGVVSAQDVCPLG
jgi:hypothetical protein